MAALASPSSPSLPSSRESHPPRFMSNQEDLTWLIDILRSVQLEQFFVRIRDQLQVTRLEHFEYVTVEDLEKVIILRRSHALKYNFNFKKFNFVHKKNTDI